MVKEINPASVPVREAKIINALKFLRFNTGQQDAVFVSENYQDLN